MEEKLEEQQEKVNYWFSDVSKKGKRDRTEGTPISQRKQKLWDRYP